MAGLLQDAGQVDAAGTNALGGISAEETRRGLQNYNTNAQHETDRVSLAGEAIGAAIGSIWGQSQAGAQIGAQQGSRIGGIFSGSGPSQGMQPPTQVDWRPFRRQRIDPQKLNDLHEELAKFAPDGTGPARQDQAEAPRPTPYGRLFGSCMKHLGSDDWINVGSSPDGDQDPTGGRQ